MIRRRDAQELAAQDGPGGDGPDGPPAWAVEVRDVGYSYPDGHVALDGVDLAIRPGERLALLGPNGAGKTTLMLHLNGVLMPTRGHVAIDGTRIEKCSLREVRRRVGLVFQDPDDQLFMPTLAEDVAFGPANFGVEGSALVARVDEALAAVGMTEHATRSPHHLSGGQRRRGALASVLSCRPDVLVLDEPSANLDPVARRELADTLLGIDTTMIVVTHDLPYAAQLCERAVIVDAGRVVADGPILDILEDSTTLAAHRLELPWGFDIAAMRDLSDRSGRGLPTG